MGKHLLEQKKGAQAGGVEQPMTPPEDPAQGSRKEMMPHRTQGLPRGVLKKPWAPKTRQGVHISLVRELPQPKVVSVESYRGYGEQLWFTMPGAVVCCDNCEQGVPQSMGTLHGAPTQSQFAQNMFLCSSCMGM